MMSNPSACAKNINKTPDIKAFIQTSFLDWRGRICPVIFLGNCNFRCPYCHNKDLVLYPDMLSTTPLSDVLDCISSHEGWLDGIVISGGEPCLNPGLPDFIKGFRKAGLQTKIDTNGSNPKLLARLIHEGIVDYVAMDFKAPLNEFIYRRCTGVWTDIGAIGQSLDLLLKGAVDYEFRVTVCPGLLDVEDIVSMAKRIKDAKRFVLQNFVAQNTLDPSYSKIAPYPMEKLEEMKNAASVYVKDCMVISPH